LAVRLTDKTKSSLRNYVQSLVTQNMSGADRIWLPE
jgi:hypothetical protein